MQVISVQADYEVEVRTQEFTNTRFTTVERQGLTGGDACCDIGDNGCSTGSEQCDVYFIYCLRPFDTMGFCDQALPSITTSIDNDDNWLSEGELDGIIPNNPFTLTIPGLWQVFYLFFYKKIMLVSSFSLSGHTTLCTSIRL